MRIDAPFAISVIIGGLIGAAGLVIALTWPWSGLPGIMSGAPQGVESPAGSSASPDAPGAAGQPGPAASGTVAPSSPSPLVTVASPAARTVAPTPASPTLPPAPPAAVTPVPPAAVTGADSTGQHAIAARLLSQGRLQEAQDVYLDVLLNNPADGRAIEGLVAVRRRMAGDDPALLRRQAAAYQRAAAAGVETDEHYTPRAMRELARACLLAAEEAEAEQRTTGRPTPAPLPAPSATRRGQQPPRVVVLPATPQEVAAATPEARPATPRGVRTPTPRPRPSPSPSLRARRTPTPRPAARVSPSPRSRRPRPTPVPPKVQVTPVPPKVQVTPVPPKVQVTPVPPRVQVTPSPPSTSIPKPLPSPPATRTPPDPETEPYYLVQIGPFRDRDLASEVAAQLTIAGFAPRMSAVEEARRFEVLSETLPISVAERRVEALAALGFRARIRLIGGGQAQLEFGVFVSEENAEALARRIRSRGYFAMVVREGGALYMITLGPYTRSAVDAITRSIRARFGASVPINTTPAGPP